MSWVLEKNWVIQINWMRGKKNGKFTQGLLQLFFTSFGKKHLNEYIIYYNFSFLIEKALRNKFITQSYLSFLNSFLFLSRFSVSLKSLKSYFFRRFAYKSLLNRFRVLINYVMWSSSSFFYNKLFPTFFMFRFFWVQIF